MRNMIHSKSFFLLPALLLSFLLVGIVGCPNKTTSPGGGGWVEATAHAGWSPRYGMGSAVFNGEMWVAGGAWGISGSVTQYYGGVYHSSNGIQWSSTVGDNNISNFGQRYSPGLLSYNNKLWLIGGNENGTLKNDVWSSTDGSNWSLVTINSGFTPREDFISIVYNNAMWVMTGWGPADDGDIWTSTNGSTWTNVTPVVSTSPIPTYSGGFRARWGSSAVVFNNLVYIIDGDEGNAYGSLVGTAYTDEWTFDGVNLTLLNDYFMSINNLTAMVYHQITFNNGILWLTPGVSPGYSIYAGYYTSTDAVNWTPYSTYYLPRAGHSALSFNNSLWVMGGYGCSPETSCSVTYFNDVWHTP